MRAKIVSSIASQRFVDGTIEATSLNDKCSGNNSAQRALDILEFSVRDLHGPIRDFVQDRGSEAEQIALIGLMAVGEQVSVARIGRGSVYLINNGKLSRCFDPSDVAAPALLEGHGFVRTEFASVSLSEGSSLLIYTDKLSASEEAKLSSRVAELKPGAAEIWRAGNLGVVDSELVAAISLYG